MLKNNKAFTLIELIFAIGIIFAFCGAIAGLYALVHFLMKYW